MARSLIQNGIHLDRYFSGFYQNARATFTDSFTFNSVCKVDASNEFLHIDNNKSTAVYSFYPIPFTAAKGVDKWRGAASGCFSLDSFEDMNNAIDQIGKTLKGKNTWTFQSDKWKDISWDTNLGLSHLNVEEQYIGIIPEDSDMMKVFPKS